MRPNTGVRTEQDEQKEVGGNDGLIDPGGRTRRLTNDQLRWQLGQTKSRKGGTERSRWMRSRVMLLKLMFPRPVVQFLCRINAPSITPLCLVSGGGLNQSPNNTFPCFKGDGRRSCIFLLVSIQATVNFIKNTNPDTRKEFHPHGAEYQRERY